MQSNAAPGAPWRENFEGLAAGSDGAAMPGRIGSMLMHMQHYASVSVIAN